MISENNLVNTSKICQRVDIGIKRIEEIRPEAGRLRLIESVSFLKVSFRWAKDSYLHEIFFLILFLACSQSDAVTLPAIKASSRSLRTVSCQAGDLSFFSSWVRSAQRASIKFSFCTNESWERDKSTRFIVFPFSNLSYWRWRLRRPPGYGSSQVLITIKMASLQ
jgi:hypothetical protein